MDMRAHRPADEAGFGSQESIYRVVPWSTLVGNHRSLLYISAYPRTDFSVWASSTEDGARSPSLSQAIPETAADTLGKPGVRVRDGGRGVGREEERGAGGEASEREHSI